MKICAVIISESKATIKAISSFAKNSEYKLEIIYIAYTLSEGFEILQETHADLVFLDSDLSGEMGTQLLHDLKHKELETKTVCISNNLDNSIKAIRHSVLDFLLKPISPGELTYSIERYIEKKRIEVAFTIHNKEQIEILKQKLSHVQASLQPFPIPSIRGLEFILVSEIIRCESDSNTCSIFSEERDPYNNTNYTLKELQNRLEPYGFIRVHQSHLVNKSKIRSLHGKSLYLSNGEFVPVSRRNLPLIRNGFRCL